MPEPVVRTVLGDVPAGTLGPTDSHEHLFQVSPLLPGDELDDLEAAVTEAAALRAAGIATLVDLTPPGLGRDPAGLVAVAERTGLRVVMATGAHRDEHHRPDDPLTALPEERLAEVFAGEVEGQPGRSGPAASGPSANRATGRGRSGTGHRPVLRAGVIKVGVGYWRISARERRVLAAAAAAARRTGAAVVCHLELGTAAVEVLEALTGAGLGAERVALAHADRNPDPGLHLELAAAGAYLGYDGWARARHWPDSVLLDCLLAVAAGGGADRLLLGGDVARRSAWRAHGGLPGLDYLPRRVLPRLRAAAGDELTRRVLEANPARLLALTPPAQRGGD